MAQARTTSNLPRLASFSRAIEARTFVSFFGPRHPGVVVGLDDLPAAPLSNVAQVTYLILD
jgi:hypothetical protein